jgi:hypothetical protein
VIVDIAALERQVILLANPLDPLEIVLEKVGSLIEEEDGEFGRVLEDCAQGQLAVDIK